MSENIPLDQLVENLALMITSQSSSDILVDALANVDGISSSDLDTIIERLTKSISKQKETQAKKNVQKIKEMAAALNIDVASLLPDYKKEYIKKGLEHDKQIQLKRKSLNTEKKRRLVVYKYKNKDGNDIWELRAHKNRLRESDPLFICAKQNGKKISDYACGLIVTDTTDNIDTLMPMTKYQYEQFAQNPTIQYLKELISNQN